MSTKRLLYLGGQSQISNLIENICKEYVHLRSVHFGSEAFCDKEQLRELDGVLINLMHPWDVQMVAKQVLEYDLPFIGVHTFDQERIIESYMKKGLTKYVPLFQLEDHLMSDILG